MKNSDINPEGDVNIIYTAYQLLFFFIIYAFLGWCLEVAYQAVEHGIFINRGFLNGPYCPIYGFGMITVMLVLYPLQENFVALYIGSVFLTTLLEFVTGFFLEKIFSQHWWDYSSEKFNIKGYICLKFSLLWGVACLVAVRIIHPATERFVNCIPEKIGIIILILCYIGFLSDAAITIAAIMKIKKRLKLTEDISKEMRKISDITGEHIFETVKNIQEKNEELHNLHEQQREKFEELKAKYQEIIESQSGISKRIEKAFPQLDISLREKIDKLLMKIDKK